MNHLPESAINENQLLYLNGFLEAVAGYNTFTNDSKYYYAQLLDKVAGTDIQDTLRTGLGVKHWLITHEPIIGDWKPVLTQELRPYFGQIITEARRGLSPDNQAKPLPEEPQNERLPIGLMLDFFIINLTEVVPANAVLSRVKVDSHPAGVESEGFYECYENDYLFNLPNQILFLHFGSSD